MRNEKAVGLGHLETEMFKSVVFEVEGVWPGAVRLTLLPAGVEEVGDASQLEVGGLLHGEIVADLNVPVDLI